SVFREIRKKMPAKLLLIGDGPERANIEHLCRQLDVCADIHFMGKTNDVERVLVHGDLFILPSETESFGLAALEAMAAGMPVISSNTGGLPEVNAQGKSGFLCDVGDIADMGNKAVQILGSADVLAAFKLGAREQA